MRRTSSTRPFHTPAPGRPLFQAATANLFPWTVAKADARNPARGPMLVVTGEKDHIVPFALANAAYKRQKKNPARHRAASRSPASATRW